MASVAAGALLGVPFVPSGTFRAAWVEVSEWIARAAKIEKYTGLLPPYESVEPATLPRIPVERYKKPDFRV